MFSRCTVCLFTEYEIQKLLTPITYVLVFFSIVRSQELDLPYFHGLSFAILHFFLDASSYFYKWVCSSVCGCVRPSVCPKVRPSVSDLRKSTKKAILAGETIVVM